MFFSNVCNSHAQLTNFFQFSLGAPRPVRAKRKILTNGPGLCCDDRALAYSSGPSGCNRLLLYPGLQRHGWRGLAMLLELCKGVHCVDLGESFQTHIFLQNLASIRPRTSPVKFVRPSNEAHGAVTTDWVDTNEAAAEEHLKAAASLRWSRNAANSTGFVLGCIETKFCKSICV